MPARGVAATRARPTLERRHRDLPGDQVWKLSDRHDGLSGSCTGVGEGRTPPTRPGHRRLRGMRQR